LITIVFKGHPIKDSPKLAATDSGREKSPGEFSFTLMRCLHTKSLACCAGYPTPSLSKIGRIPIRSAAYLSLIHSSRVVIYYLHNKRKKIKALTLECLYKNEIINIFRQHSPYFYMVVMIYSGRIWITKKRKGNEYGSVGVDIQS
jgi:hypothetical protein